MDSGPLGNRKKAADKHEVAVFNKSKSLLGYCRDSPLGNREAILNEAKVKLAEIVIREGSEK